MLKELEDVLVLITELPDKHQVEAAEALRRIVMTAEEAMLMTWDERRRLQIMRYDEIAQRRGWKTHAELVSDAKKELDDSGGELVDMSGILKERPNSQWWDVQTYCGEEIGVPLFWLKALGLKAPKNGDRIQFVARVKVSRSYHIEEFF